MKTKDDILPEYDFSKGTRGKYSKQYAKSTNLIAIAPDVLKSYANAEAINETLRAVAKIAAQTKNRKAA